MPKSLILVNKNENKTVPEHFTNAQDSTNTAKTIWKEYFTDPNLLGLIDTAFA